MSESLVQQPRPPGLIVPASIQAVIDGFESGTYVFTCMSVSSALSAARTKLADPSPEENQGAWAEVLAFALAAGAEHNEKPWGTYFGPMGSGAREDGGIVYFPDVRQADVAILQHWKERARGVKSPILSGRYNDLVWDLSKLIANEKRDVSYARRAIDAYLITAQEGGRDACDAFADAERALALSIQIDDLPRRDRARAALLALHGTAMAKNAMWWKAYDALEAQPKSGLTDEERDALVADLEAVLVRCADTSVPSRFNPHDAESAANKLITHYQRTNRAEELERLHLTVAKAFERFGSMADPMFAATVLQTSMEAYRQAGSKNDERRILGLIEKANEDSIAQMTRVEHREEIPAETIEQFLAQVVADTKNETFHRVAGEFLTARAEIEKILADSQKESPLATIIPRTMLRGNRVVAHIGTIWDDPVGHLINETNRYISLTTPWLGWALDRAREKHTLTPEDFAAWANRTGLFGDGALLREGLSAWIANDQVKAAHLLVPQVEAGFRTLVGRAGRPTTRAHPQMPQARMVITMGEILFHEETASALGKHGPDIVLHFRAFYADPRGHNLRNDLAHGLASAESLNAGTNMWVVHSLLLLGAWLKPATESAELPTT